MKTAQYLQLIEYRAYIDLRAEAAQSYLGAVWWVLEPIMFMGVFYVVFGIVMQRGDGPSYVSFLLCGLVFWRWFDAALKRSANSMLANAAIVSQVYLPKVLLPLIEILAATYRFLIVLVLLLIFLPLIGEPPALSWLALPVVLIVQLLLIAGCGFLLAAVTPMFPDLRKILDNLLLLMFFLSGVFFDMSTLSDNVKPWLQLNPMAKLLDEYRHILIDAVMPDWSALATISLVSLCLMALGLYILQRYDKHYPKLMEK